MHPSSTTTTTPHTPALVSIGKEKSWELEACKRTMSLNHLGTESQQESQDPCTPLSPPVKSYFGTFAFSAQNTSFR